MLCEEIAHQISAISCARCPMKTKWFFAQVNSHHMLVVSVFLVMENKKALPDSWLPQQSINVVSFTRSDDDDILELHKKRTTWQHGLWWQPRSRTWKLALRLLPSTIWWFWLSETILQLNLQNIRQENLKLIF